MGKQLETLLSDMSYNTEYEFIEEGSNKGLEEV